LSLQKNKTMRSSSPVYLAILSGIILIILIINGLLEIKSNSKRFLSFCWKEKQPFFLQHFEKNIQKTFESLHEIENVSGGREVDPSFSGLLFNLEESVGEYLVEVAYNVDQIEGEKSLTPSELQSLGTAILHCID